VTDAIFDGMSLLSGSGVIPMRGREESRTANFDLNVLEAKQEGSGKRVVWNREDYK
jgi:hypothetical protein